MLKVYIVSFFLINLLVSWSQVPSWDEGQFVNWFHIKRYISVGDKRLLTYRGNVYVYDNAKKEWKADELFLKQSVDDVIYSERWALFLPSGDLLELSTESKINIRQEFDSLDALAAAFDGDTLAIATLRELVLIDLDRMQVVGRKTFFRTLSNSMELYCYGGKVCFHLSGDLYTYNFATDKTTIRGLRDALPMSTMVQRPHSSPRVPLCSDNTVRIYNFINDSLYTIYEAHPVDEIIMSVYMGDDHVYVATEKEPIAATIYEIDLSNFSSREVAHIRRRGGTGRIACDIISAEGNDFLVADKCGGLYSYNCVLDTFIWQGGGISEVDVVGITNYRDSVVAFYGVGLDVYDHRSHERVFLPNLMLPIGEDIEMYRDYIAVNLWGNMMLYDIYNYEDQKCLSQSARDFIVIGDTVVVYSDYQGTFKYDGSEQKISDLEDGYLATDQVYIGIYKHGFDIVVQPILGGLSNTYRAPADTTSILFAMHDSIMIFNSQANIFAYNYRTSQVVWELVKKTEFIKEILWCGKKMLVLGTGEFININNGDVEFHVDSGVSQVVVSRDTCFVFYSFKDNLKGSWCIVDGVEANSDFKSQWDIKILSTAILNLKYILFHTSRYGYGSVTVYDILGYKVLTLFDGYITSGEHRIPLNVATWKPGLYFVVLRQGENVSTKKIVVVK